MYSGCIHAPVYDSQGNEVDNEKCPFCRTPTLYTKEEANRRNKKRIEAGDPMAILNHGFYHYYGTNGYPQDYVRALKQFYRSAELGYPLAYHNIGYAHYAGRGVEVDKKKAKCKTRSSWDEHLSVFV